MRAAMQPVPVARGFTVVELLVVLAMIALLAALAMPALDNVLAAQRLRAAGTDLMSALLVARSEAVKRNVQVQVMPRAGDAWGTGWRVVVVGVDEVIDDRTSPGHRVEVTRAPARVVYDGNGRLVTFGVARVELMDAERAPGVHGRCITVTASGLPRITQGACA